MNVVWGILAALLAAGNSAEAQEDDNPPQQNLGPDLVVESMILRDRSDNTFRFEYLVKNIGTAPIRLGETTRGRPLRATLQTRLSQDRRWSRDDDPSGGWSFPVRDRSPLILLPGDTYGAELQVRRKRKGDRYLLLMVDSSNQITETDEENNVGVLDLASEVVPKREPESELAATTQPGKSPAPAADASGNAESYQASETGSSSSGNRAPSSRNTRSPPVWFVGLIFAFVFLGLTSTTGIFAWIIWMIYKQSHAAHQKSRTPTSIAPSPAVSYRHCGYCGTQTALGKNCRNCGAPVN